MDTRSREWQARWVQEIEGVESFEGLERLVQEFTDELTAKAPSSSSRPRGRRRPPRVGPNPRRPYYASTSEERRRLRHLYYTDRRRALKEICGGSFGSCDIPLDRLYRHFQDAFERKDGGSLAPCPRDLPPLWRVDADLELCRPFTPKEVNKSLCQVKKGGKTESISPQLLRQSDPNCHILTAIFNQCLQFCCVPLAWKESKTILTYKDGDPGHPRNWRPVFLCPPLYKMFVRCLARRIRSWATRGQAISPEQKAYAPSSEGHCENVFLLQSVLDVAWTERTECAVAKLDLANAFGSVSHQHLFATLSELGMPQNSLRLLRELYRGCTTVVRTANGETKAIALWKGLKQGCPLSPLLFILAMEPLIRYVAKGPGGFCLYQEKVSVLAYSDDLMLIARNRALLQEMLNRASAAADWMGLSFNASKCATLHMCNRRLCSSQFRVQGKPMTPLYQGEALMYLGVPVCPPGQCPQVSKATFGKLMEEAEKIDQSHLHPNQKMDALRTYLMPKISVVLKNVPVSKKDLHGATRTIATMVAGWFPEDPRAVFDCLFSQDGKGILDVQNLADVAVVSHAFRLLTCPDETVAKVALGGLRSSAEKNTGQQNLSTAGLEAYLNGSSWDGSGGAHDRWSRARNATWRLRDLVRWSCDSSGKLTLNITQSSGEELAFSSGDRGLEGTLRKAVKESLFN